MPDNTRCKTLFAAGLLFFFLFGLTACRSSDTDRFGLQDIAKTDVNQVIEIHLSQVTDLVEKLTVKLYKRNPAQLSKGTAQTVARQVERITQCPVSEGCRELGFKTGTDAILLGLDENFRGDRVFAVMYGLYSMILQSYDNQCRFFFVHRLNQQKLYNSARNIEVLVWRLKNRTGPEGKPLILSNATSGPVVNISFERLFGKLISLQDTLAEIVSRRTNRTIKKLIHFTGMSFLPINF